MNARQIAAFACAVLERMRNWFSSLSEDQQGGLLTGGAVLGFAAALWRMSAVLSVRGGGVLEGVLWCFLVVPLTFAVAALVSHFCAALLERHLTPEQEDRLDDWLRRNLSRWLGD